MHAVVCITRNKKGTVHYRSGLIYFKSYDSLIDFRSQTNLESYEVDLKEAHKPEEEGKGIWCSYCQTRETWKKLDGYKCCPICGMTDSDFYIKLHNKLW